MKIAFGSAGEHLKKTIGNYLGIEPVPINISKFPDGELRVQIGESIRGEDIYLVQPTAPPVNNNLMELLLIIDAFRRASCGEINVIIPYYGYARQDRKSESRVPISAKLVTNMIVDAGADRLVTFDLHSSQIQGFTDIPVDNLYGSDILMDYYAQKLDGEDVTVITPDLGGVKVAYCFANRVGGEFAVVDQTRIDGDKSEIVGIIGNVKGRKVIICDDIIDTAGTIIRAVRTLTEEGAEDIFVSATHGLFSNNALDRLEKENIKEVAVTDTCGSRSHFGDRVTVISIAELLGDAIKRLYNNKSLGAMFLYNR